MEDFKYRYLFPYEKVPAGSRIVIYGAGDLGRDYLLQMQLTHYCEVVAMADKNFAKYPSMLVPVIDPGRIHKLSFDYVVLALRVAVAENEMLRVLREQGVGQDRVICVFERSMEDRMPVMMAGAGTMGAAGRDGGMFIALLVAGGMGDHVIQKRLLTELMRLAPDVPIDIYAIRHVEYLRYLYSDCVGVRNVIEDLGSRYGMECGSYALSMSVEACHYLRIDVFKEEMFLPDYSELVKRLRILKEETEKDAINLGIPVHVSNLRRQYRGLNAYSGFNYKGAFDVDDKKISIPLTGEGEMFYRRQALGAYATVNYGSGECRDGRRVAKMWPIQRFGQVALELKKRHPDIAVIQLGASDTLQIDGADRYILGEKMEHVASVLKHALFHLDIEGGLVHIASQLGTKCIVLFGPTSEKYYGYDGNINIHAGNCRGCWGLYTDVNRCARDMAEPECMYSITPEMVLGHIEEYLGSIGHGRDCRLAHEQDNEGIRGITG